MNYFAGMKPITLFGSSLMIIFISLSALAFINNKHAAPEKHVEIVLRNLGHQLLLFAGDSTSRVLPIKKVTENSYQISFEHNFSLISDTLISLVQRIFKANALPNDYIVSLKNCKQTETVFAFEINSQTGNLTGCRGRKLAAGCYIIEIDFLKKAQFNAYWLLLSIIPLGLLGLYLKNKFGKKEEQKPVDDIADYIQLASFQFYADNNLLKRRDRTIALSEKETKALTIFAENINQIVEREKLMKEIWEDNGIVVISRNVDVLVSKLRKLLIDDASIKFITVPGRGYKFTIE